MGLFLGDSEPSKIFVGDTQISKVFLGDTQVRPSGWHPGANTVAYRPLTTTTTVNDQSGNNYTLTKSKNGGMFTTIDGVECFYYYADGYPYGTLSVTSAPLIPSGGDNRTISIWAMPVQITGDRRGIVKYGGNSTGQITAIDISSRGLYEASVGNRKVSGPSVTLNKWSHFVFTVDGELFYFYIDGELIGSNTKGDTLPVSSSRPLRIGAYDGWTSSVFRGYTSECIIENIARPAQKISDYYDQTKGTYGL